MISEVILGSEDELRAISTRACLLPDDVSVVDLGAGMSRLPRANYVVDLMPYGSSRQYGKRCDGLDRCPPENWIVHDLCDPMPFFSAGQFGYSFCSQTVEDVRDPIGLVREINRISRSGFISTIHWKYELYARISKYFGSPTDEFVGYWHHRWIVNVHNGVLEFVSKPAFVQWGFGEMERPTIHMIHVSWENGVDAAEVLYSGSPDRESFIRFLMDRWGND